ncbi:MAG: type II toxin-antitoxin system RelE/ParE family toxin [Lancefieldella rimae]|uniref:Type II toxin-antitoxin system RelE/ParE family toxin n=1 Tax=Lancefieldella rimae TaxID=1383 RepID=A0A930YS18_9ACTN|nr:type II toxin-antitoxin system RelE/ParE family toxin [Lancefieldella rimae]
MSNHYKVTYTPQALQDLTELYEYICFILRTPKAAENQSSRIRRIIRSLDIMPMRHSLVPWEPWYSMGIRKVSIDSYMAFYCVDKEKGVVTVIRIFYSGRNIKDIIKNTSNSL